MALARCQARKAPRLLVSKLNVFLLLLLKTQTNIKEPYSPKAQFMFAQHLILKRNFKRHLFEIIPRQTVLLCARKGGNKYKKKPGQTFILNSNSLKGSSKCGTQL